MKEKIIIKNNSNTSLQEVLDGKGVFVFDDTEEGDTKNQQDYRHEGRTYKPEGVTDEFWYQPENQYFDYVQYMLNMVTVPLVTTVEESNLKYAIEPNGVFGTDTENLLKALTFQEGASIPNFSDKSFNAALTGVISHHQDILDHEPVGEITGPSGQRPATIGTFTKLLIDYQDIGDEINGNKTDNIDKENNIYSPPRMDKDEWRTKIITPEMLRGVFPLHEISTGSTLYTILSERISAEAITAATASGSAASSATAPGERFHSSSLISSGQTSFDHPEVRGIYHLYYHYDWDGDGVSNLAEVENEAGGLSPLVYAETNSSALQLKTTYSRGNVSVNGSATAPTGPGLGELSATDGSAVSGLRLPTFGPGFYDFPNRDPLNIDAYTSARVLRILERSGRTWADIQPDAYPLLTREQVLAHNKHRDQEQDVTSARRFGLNDLSGRAGGINRRSICLGFPDLRVGREIPYTCTLDHAAHNNGLDMDIRYVHKDSTETIVLMPGAGVFDSQATIDLINLITNNGTDLALLILGSAMSPADRTSFDNAFGTLIASNSDHDNHIHIRLAAEPNSLPDSSRFTVLTSNLQLSYVEGNSTASTHTIEFQVFDMNENPLLPWTRLSYQSTSTAANVTGMNLVSNVPYDSGRVWVNISNEASRQGYGSIKVECLSTGLVNITLSDAGGNNAGTIDAQCQ